MFSQILENLQKTQKNLPKQENTFEKGFVY